MTNGDKFNTGTPRPPCILIAPLDWGLGHATRCIPIIKLLTDQGCRVILAASGKQARLLAAEFPKVDLLPLPGYGLRYSASSRLNSLKILSQLPKILISIKRENQWLDTLLQQQQIDIIISDCRFGLHHKNVFNVLMTHQLAIQSPFKWAEGLLRAWNYRFINRFNECWVPDQKDAPNLAGDISHPSVLPKVPVKYIGCLSRFHDKGFTNRFAHKVLIILSGPEPQRTVLENMIMKELLLLSDPSGIVLIRGLPDTDETLRIPRMAVINHLPAQELEIAMLKSEIVISRSGYTSVMDIMKLGKKSVLVPTPGQLEQEYLGKYLSQQHWCACMQQRHFSLAKALQLADDFPYAYPEGLQMELYKQQVMQTVHHAMGHAMIVGGVLLVNKQQR